MIAFWPSLVFTLCPSSPRFQLKCLAHFLDVASEVIKQDVLQILLQLSWATRLGRCQNVFLFQFLLLCYNIEPILPNFLAGNWSWNAGNEIIWSYLTFVWRLQAGNRLITSRKIYPPQLKTLSAIAFILVHLNSMCNISLFVINRFFIGNLFSMNELYSYLP